MNYCYACRRHLNGAFSCPGCGAIVDRSAMPDEADTAQLPPVTDEVSGGDADLPPPVTPSASEVPVTPAAPAEGSLVDDLLRDSGLGPDAGPDAGPAAESEPGTEPEPLADVPEAAPVAVAAAYDGPAADTGSGRYGDGPGDDADDDRLRNAALADSLLGVGVGSGSGNANGGGGNGGFGGGYREDPDGGRSARRRRGRHQRAAILGVGAVAVVGSLTMFGVAALSGGSSDPSTGPGPSVTAVSPSAGTGLPSPDGTSPSAPDGGGTSPSASPSGSGKASGSPSASASHTAASSAPASSSPGKPSHSPSASPSRTTGAPPSTTKPPTTPPASPTPTCTKVLWWCQ